MKNGSIWISNRDKQSDKSKLNENISCDVLIIGGGIAGLSTAYQLMDTNKKIVLVDKGKCGMGATSKNTGKLTWMQDLIYGRLSYNYNNDIAKLYLDSQNDAIKIVRDIIVKNKIDCHLTKTKSYDFSYNGNDYDKFSREIEFYKNNDIKYRIKSQQN